MKVVYTDKHAIHAPRFMVVAGKETPHCEVPQRVERILASVNACGFPVISPRSYPDDLVKQVHSEEYLGYLRTIYQAWTAANMPAQGVIPDTFPSRFRAAKPGNLISQPGWYCFDTCAPIVRHTYEAAVSSAWCALTGADLLLEGEAVAYSLCRPPGHHAGTDFCGGFCYLNNIAIAARYLLDKAKIAILDIDYHHGNGTEEIFANEKNLLFVSIHGDPDVDFPFYWGRTQEIADGIVPHILNIPLPPGTKEADYLPVLHRALETIRRFNPGFLLISFGTDTYRHDPIGLFNLETDSYTAIGEAIAGMSIPTLIIQEGGYHTSDIGICVTNFLKSFGNS